jgi:hypothetical protein
MIWRTIFTVWHLLLGWGGLVAGTLYAVFRGTPEVLKIMDELLFRFRDFAVFEIIDVRRYWDVPDMDPETGIANRLITELAPHFVEDIAARLKRSSASVLSSLKRLKRTGKAVEADGGWYSNRIAPKDY